MTVDGEAVKASHTFTLCVYVGVPDVVYSFKGDAGYVD